MIDSRFVIFKGALSLGELAHLAKAEIVRGDVQQSFQGVNPLEEATADEVSLFHNPKYKDALSRTRAGALVLAPGAVDSAPPGAALLVTQTPLKSFTRILTAFYAEDEVSPEIHPQAMIDPSATLGEGCRVGLGAVIEAHATLGPNCWIDAQAHVGRGVVLGRGCRVGAHVTLTHALVGDDVFIKPGARIGQRGFGFFLEESVGAHETQLQLGRVLIGNRVEIGSNTTIDRGSLRDTIIEDDVRIDNLVQIAHNVRIGRGTVIVAQVGIAGSSSIGAQSVLAGQVGVAGHLTLGTRVRVAAKSGVMNHLGDGEAFAGIPAVPIQQWRRQSVLIKRMVRGSEQKEANADESAGSERSGCE